MSQPRVSNDDMIDKLKINNLGTKDQQQRQQALNIEESFIVQAPAGSGKTTLLIQRYLALLGRVENPEEVIAITFTKKAVTEMKARVLKALETAKKQIWPPQHSSQKQTWQLARQVIERDSNKNWQLLTNPNRLRIQTIDSLCYWLSNRLPILSRLGSQATLCDQQQANKLYQQAIHNLFDDLLDSNKKTSQALENFLLHLDNRLERAEELLISLLQKRDQWLPYIIPLRQEKNSQSIDIVKQILEQGLTNIHINLVKKMLAFVKSEQWQQLLSLLGFANVNCNQDGYSNHIASCSAITDGYHWLSKKSQDHATMTQQRQLLLAIGKLLLKDTDNQPRKRFDKRIGFPTAKNEIEAKHYHSSKATLKSMKQTMKSFMADISTNQPFINALQHYQLTPNFNYTDQQWQMIESLITLLPRLASELHMMFKKESQVDFIAVTQAALTALGDELCPSDLALQLDYQIHHLLIDEFQDTSVSQFQLIERLIDHWRPQDGHSIFIVGDPMQSIYRFRNAEVSLFLKTKNQGIGQLKPISLILYNNFRSTKQIIAWVNHHLSHCFPKDNQPEIGAINYSQAYAALSYKPEDSQINCYYLTSRQKEAKLICDLIKTSQKNHPEHTIAVLTRTRSHLTDLLSELGRQHIDYQAVNIETLWQQSIIQDLFALSQALLSPANSIAWLSLLRAPFCGLSLSSLHLLANNRGQQTIYQQIQQPEIINQLASSDYNRLLFLRQHISQAIDHRSRQSFRDLVEQTWLHLRGNLCLKGDFEVNLVSNYFNLLDDIVNPYELDELKKRLQTQQIDSNNGQQKLQLLTIHKAKGLEFDVVILMGLGNRLKSSDQELFLWQKQSLDCGFDWLIAPIKSATDDDNKLYNYLKYQQQQSEKYETIRLLYVAVTRAKHSLYLTAQQTTSAENNQSTPLTNSLLSYLWPSIKEQIQYPNELTDQSPQQATLTDPQAISFKPIPLQRLNDDYFLKKNVADNKTSATKYHSHGNQLLASHNNQQTIIGIVAHRILEQISQDGLKLWPVSRLAVVKKSWQQQLVRLGIKKRDVEYCLTILIAAIRNTLADSQGRWILQKHPKEDQTELALVTHINQGELRSIRIDRTFIDQYHHRWIIDYKIINQHLTNQADKDHFIRQQSDLYQQQLQRYAHMIANYQPDYKIRSGLYFPLQLLFYEIKE